MRTDFIIVASAHLVSASDPITSFMDHDWAAVGGWGLFLGLCLTIVYGSFRELWVPGARYKRLEEANKELTAALTLVTNQNSELIQSGRLSDYFFKEVLPNKTGAQP